MKLRGRIWEKSKHLGDHLEFISRDRIEYIWEKFSLDKRESLLVWCCWYKIWKNLESCLAIQSGELKTPFNCSPAQEMDNYKYSKILYSLQVTTLLTSTMNRLIFSVFKLYEYPGRHSTSQHIVICICIVLHSNVLLSIHMVAYNRNSF